MRPECFLERRGGGGVLVGASCTPLAGKGGVASNVVKRGIWALSIIGPR